MATSESAPEGENTGASGSKVQHAAALAVLAEEPSKGLFPAADPAAGTSSPASAAAATAVAAGSAPRSAAGPGDGPGGEPTGKKTPAGEESTSGREPQPATAGNDAPKPGTTTAAGTAEGSTAEGSAAEGSTQARTKTEAEAKAGTDTDAEAGLAAAAPPATASRRTAGLPIGRPGKPMIAAAVVGGLVLIGVPFLISGPDDKNGPAAANAPVGSPMGPDGTGPGIVPGEQRAPDSGSLKEGAKHAGAPGTADKGSTKVTGGIHEGGAMETKGEAGSGTAPGTKHASRTGTGGSPDSDTNTGTGTGTGTGRTATEKSGTSGSTTSSGSGSTQKSVAQSAVVYTGITGRGCPTPSGGGHQRDNFYTDGSNGWYARSSGGWTGDGCNGSYDSVPMSGDTSTDMQNRVKWWWNPGTKARTCQISVYIPNSGDVRYVGGHPTTYHVLVNANDRTTKYDSFTINQVNHRGQWVNAGTFAMKGPTIGVKLLDRGDDWSKGWEKAHHAAAQMKATCRS
ncbi:hypothetical protein [Streptomyces sp. NPDC014744]|uniref:hypothetical protein n=1 Tax=Streptomyces sp. NPDC014744 TaxID=3364903 RepID=UPI0037022236